MKALSTVEGDHAAVLDALNELMERITRTIGISTEKNDE